MLITVGDVIAAGACIGGAWTEWVKHSGGATALTPDQARDLGGAYNAIWVWRAVGYAGYDPWCHGMGYGYGMSNGNGFTSRWGYDDGVCCYGSAYGNGYVGSGDGHGCGNGDGCNLWEKNGDRKYG